MSAAPDAGRPRVPAPPAEPVPTPGGAFARLVEIMRVLRSPEGCPWDREQTPATLAPFVLEEAHEVVDAIERGDLGALSGEVGDLIFEGVFLAQLCAETGAFTAADALHHVNEKLIRRHPHVFVAAASPETPATPVTTPTAVVEQWEQIKARERAGTHASRAGTLDGIPRTLPALLTAHEIATRVSAVGFDWARPDDVVAKIEEEVTELRRAVAEETPARAAEELGDLLFAIASLARKLGLEPEAALRAANRKFAARFRALEEEVERRGQRVEALSLDDLEAIWQDVKRVS
jgi:ATP diphosphatase